MNCERKSSIYNRLGLDIKINMIAKWNYNEVLLRFDSGFVKYFRHSINNVTYYYIIS